MFEKTLQDLVKGVRNASNDSAAYIAKATQEIKEELKSRDVTIKAQALQKLTYVSNRSRLFDCRCLRGRRCRIMECTPVSTCCFCWHSAGIDIRLQGINESADAASPPLCTHRPLASTARSSTCWAMT